MPRVRLRRFFLSRITILLHFLRFRARFSGPLLPRLPSHPPVFLCATSGCSFGIHFNLSSIIHSANPTLSMTLFQYLVEDVTFSLLICYMLTNPSRLLSRALSCSETSFFTLCIYRSFPIIRPSFSLSRAYTYLLLFSTLVNCRVIILLKRAGARATRQCMNVGKMEA